MTGETAASRNVWKRLLCRLFGHRWVEGRTDLKHGARWNECRDCGREYLREWGCFEWGP